MKNTAATIPTPRRAAEAVLNGFSQIYITTHPIAGIFVLAGLFYASVPTGLLASLGLVITTLTLRLDKGIGAAGVNEGLAGYNGALIGAASYVTWQSLGSATAVTVLGAFAGAEIHRLFNWLLSRPAIRRFQLPVFTAPFCVTAGILLLAAQNYVPPADLDPIEHTGVIRQAVDVVLGNVAEVMLVDNTLTGLLVLIGLTIASWRIGLAALLGATGEMLMDLATGGDMDKMQHGLLGYSGVLVAIALGVLFINGSWIRRVSAAVVGLLISQLFAYGMSFTPIPTYTWPFIIPAWIVLMVWPTIWPEDDAVPLKGIVVARPQAQRSPGA